MSENNPLSGSELAARNDELATLAQTANEAHQRVAESLAQAVANALEVGGALSRAKEICPDGKFTAWLRKNCDYSLSTARGYIRLMTNWNRLSPDQQRAGGLSQRQLTNLLKGLPCSDGRENPHARRLAPAAEALAESAAPSPAITAADWHGTPEDQALTKVNRLLGQIVTELRRVADGNARSSYCAHILRLLEPIFLGIPTREWFGNMLPSNR